MSTFKVLEYNEIYMSWLGIRPNRFDKDSNDFFQSLWPYCVLSVNVCTTASSVVYVRTNWPHLDIVAQACVVCMSMIQTGGMFFSFGLNAKLVKAVHCQLQEIGDGQGDSNKNKNKRFIFTFTSKKKIENLLISLVFYRRSAPESSIRNLSKYRKNVL